MSIGQLARTAVFCIPMAVSLVGAAQPSDFFNQVASFLGISATPSQMKAPDTDAAIGGNVWIAEVATDERSQVTADGGFSWPVFDPLGGRILALQQEAVYEIPLAGGPAHRLTSVDGIVKLIGFDRERPDHVLVVRVAPGGEIAVLSLASGALTPIPYDPQSGADRVMLAHLRGEDRSYGNTQLYLRRQSRTDVTGATLEWTDVFIKEGDKRPRNISTCDGANCSQPSLSADGKTVAFVRSPQT
jgi:hypothetical protein